MPDAPYPKHDIAALVAACPGVAFERDAALLRQKSRDFFWFSPILNRAFRHKTAEILAQPRTEAEVIAIAAARARLAQIIAAHEAAGIPVANPHVATVEDGSRHKRGPGDQLGFKALVDPHGLLNPGRMPSYIPQTPQETGDPG